jgi:hypothetical protein
MVIITSRMGSTGATGAMGYMSYEIGGSTSLIATDDHCLSIMGGGRSSMISVVGVTPGDNTFIAKYRTDGDWITYGDRDMNVVPI